MTLEEIASEIIGARFKEGQRGSVDRWVNMAYAKIWHADDWTFRRAAANIDVLSGSPDVVGLPGDFHRAYDVYDDLGNLLQYMPPNDFYRSFYGDTTTGTPTAWSAQNRDILLGPTPSADSSSFLVLYERSFTEMVNQSDEPLIPSEFHYVLVHGGMVIGLVNENDFTFELPQRLLDEGVFAMKQGYVSENGAIQYARDGL